jgi:nitroreductase
MELFDALTHMRAMKRLKPDPVPEELLRKVVEYATHAPSGLNAYNLRYIVVRDREKKAAIGRMYRQAWNEYVAHSSSIPAGQTAEVVERTNKAVTWQANHLHEVPALIFVCMAGIRAGLSHPTFARGANGQAWVAIQNLMLACRGMGLGAAITTLHLEHEKEIDELLGIPEDSASFAMVPVGYPMGKFGPTRGVPVEHVLRWDSW